MIDIICLGESPSEAKAKCRMAEILLKMSTDRAINILKAIGGIYITESEESEGES